MVGFRSGQLSDLFSADRSIWSLGPASVLVQMQHEVSQVIFDGFRLQAMLKKAKASYFETVIAYRQTVLTAFQNVEDNLVAIRRMDEEIRTQTRATDAANRALFQANQRYRGGIATFLDVVITENQALQADLALINVQTRRQLASVQLIKALGGGWCKA
jgi:outer membrane protein TolC